MHFKQNLNQNAVCPHPSPQDLWGERRTFFQRSLCRLFGTAVLLGISTINNSSITHDGSKSSVLLLKPVLQRVKSL